MDGINGWGVRVCGKRNKNDVYANSLGLSFGNGIGQTCIHSIETDIRICRQKCAQYILARA
jgi:hypothetical protein